MLYESYGFPYELSLEIAQEKNAVSDVGEVEKEYSAELKKHKELSGQASQSAGTFKGGLEGTSEMHIRYHTATHLLHQALRDVLGDKVSQKGSNITTERLRFDFSFDRKLTDEEIKKVEEIVNTKISESLPVSFVELSLEEAQKSGALHFFNEKYPDIVKVYFVGDSLDTAYSKEFCGGPHISNTSELGTFKITKEEAVSQGVRRIKAILI